MQKVTKAFKGQKLGQFYHLTALHSWTLDSLSLKNPFPAIVSRYSDMICIVDFFHFSL